MCCSTQGHNDQWCKTLNFTGMHRHHFVHTLVSPLHAAPIVSAKTTSTPQAQDDDNPFSFDYIRRIVAPILLILLFLIFLALGIAITIPCIRLCVNARHKTQSRHREERTSVSLDSIGRNSVYNFYPPAPVLGM